MIRQPPKVGAIRFHHEPESSNTSHADVTATTFQGTTSVITSRGPYQLEGARWHLLTKVFSNTESFKFDFHSVILQQKRLDENPKYRSFLWQVLRKASEFLGAKSYICETGLTTPPFLSNARRGTKITWGVLDDSPAIVNWDGLDPTEQAEQEWEQVFTDTIAKEVGAAGSGGASVAARPVGPNLRQRVWLLKISSPMTNPLRFSRIPNLI